MARLVVRDEDPSVLVTGELFRWAIYNLRLGNCNLQMGWFAVISFRGCGDVRDQIAWITKVAMLEHCRESIAMRRRRRLPAISRDHANHAVRRKDDRRCDAAGAKPRDERSPAPIDKSLECLELGHRGICAGVLPGRR